MGYKVQRILIGTQQVRPPTLTYDFTQSDGGWTASSGTLRSSSGFYRSGTWSDGNITAPQEIFNYTPKKITLTYNKAQPSSGTGLVCDIVDKAIFFPKNQVYLTQVGFYNNGSWDTTVSLGGNPLGVVDWEVTIDSSTTPRTLTHKIGTYSFSDNSGYVDAMWSNKDCKVRIVNLEHGTGAIYIRGFKIEY